jgi:hypothetical protein
VRRAVQTAPTSVRSRWNVSERIPAQRRPQRPARRLPLPTPRGFWPYATVAFGVLAVLTHLPGFLRPLWSPDEAFLATQAEVLAGGGVLYEDVVDRKPPLLPFLYTLTFQLTGSTDLYYVRGLAVLAHLATALLLAAIARQRWGYRAAAAAGCLYLLGSAGLGPEDAQGASFEVFMLPAVTASMLLAQRGRHAGAGVAAALATLTKQVAGVTLLPLAWLAWRDGGRRGLLRLAAGYALPVLLLAWACGWERFVFWVVTGSDGYLDASGSWPQVLGRLTGTAGIFLGGNVAAVWLVTRAWRARQAEADLWLWLLGSVIAVCTGFHFFGHYYLQLLPPVVLLAVGALVRAEWRPWRATAALSAASALVFLGLALTWPTARIDHATEVAAVVRQHSGPQDRILVWGMDPELYWAADRTPATRFITAGFLTNFSGGRSAARVGEQYVDPGLWHEFDTDLAETRPLLIVDDSRGRAFRPERIPRLAAYLSGYERVATVDGAVVYRRID